MCKFVPGSRTRKCGHVEFYSDMSWKLLNCKQLMSAKQAGRHEQSVLRGIPAALGVPRTEQPTVVAL